jgi:membrane protease subunit HflK
MESNGSYSWTPNQQPPKPVDWKKVRRVILTVVLVLIALFAALSCFYTVDDKQQAVVTTFGKVSDITDAGLHFKLPFGIQQVERWM